MYKLYDPSTVMFFFKNNPKLKPLRIDSNASSVSNLTWTDLDKKDLVFPNDFCPTNRLYCFMRHLLYILLLRMLDVQIWCSKYSGGCFWLS